MCRTAARPRACRAVPSVSQRPPEALEDDGVARAPRRRGRAPACRVPSPGGVRLRRCGRGGGVRQRAVRAQRRRRRPAPAAHHRAGQAAVGTLPGRPRPRRVRLRRPSPHAASRTTSSSSTSTRSSTARRCAASSGSSSRGCPRSDATSPSRPARTLSSSRRTPAGSRRPRRALLCAIHTLAPRCPVRRCSRSSVHPIALVLSPAVGGMSGVLPAVR